MLGYEGIVFIGYFFEVVNYFEVYIFGDNIFVYVFCDIRVDFFFVKFVCFVVFFKNGVISVNVLDFNIWVLFFEVVFGVGNGVVGVYIYYYVSDFIIGLFLDFRAGVFVVSGVVG